MYITLHSPQFTSLWGKAVLGGQKTGENGLLPLEEEGEPSTWLFWYTAVVRGKKDKRFIHCQGCSIHELPEEAEIFLRIFFQETNRKILLLRVEDTGEAKNTGVKDAKDT